MRERKVHYPHYENKDKTACGRNDENVWVAHENEPEQVTCKECLSSIENRKTSLVGEKIGNWKVLKDMGLDKNKCLIYLCKCDCGTEKTVRKNSLLSGESISCGCVRNGKKVEKTGLSKLPIYKVWQEMVRRCTNPKDDSYKRYGARGIKVCAEWEEDPLLFIKWANQNGYCKGLSIDRIDNNKDYGPDNCKWSTPKEQARNTRRNVLVTYEGQTKSLAEWSEKTGLSYWTIKRRFRKGKLDEYFKENKVV